MFGSDPTWVDDLAKTITAKLAEQRITGWQVVPIKWREAAWGLPIMALCGARIEGALYGAEFAQQRWNHIHLIGHSAGAVLIEAFSKEIKNRAMQLTLVLFEAPNQPQLMVCPQ